MHICGFFRTFAADFNFVIMSQRYLLPLAALCLLLVSCNQNEPTRDAKDLSVAEKQYEFNDESDSYFNAYEICRFYEQEAYFGYGPYHYHIIQIDTFCYKQEGGNVYIYKDDADTIRAISYGDSIVVYKRVYFLEGIPVVENKRVYYLTIR